MDKRHLRRVSWKRWLGNLSMVLVSLMVSLVMLELALPRLVQLEEVSLVYDPVLGFRGRPNIESIHTRELKGKTRVVKTNSFGFHDIEHPVEKPQDAFRMVFVGDSFLEAYQVDIEDNFCRQIGQRLNQRPLNERIETLNHGVHGYGLGTHGLYIKEYVMNWQPDAVVLVLFIGNDLRDNYAPLASAAVPRFEWRDGQINFIPAPAYSLKFWLRDQIFASSATMRFLWRHVFAANPNLMDLARAGGLVATPQIKQKNDVYAKEMAAIAQIQIKDIKDYLDATGVQLFTLVIPDPLSVHFLAFPDRFAQSPDVVALVQEQNFLEEKVVFALEANRIPYLLPRKEFAEELAAGQEIYLNGFGHFSKTGHQEVAELFAPMLATWIQAEDGL